MVRSTETNKSARTLTVWDGEESGEVRSTSPCAITLSKSRGTAEGDVHSCWFTKSVPTSLYFGLDGETYACEVGIEDLIISWFLKSPNYCEQMSPAPR